MRPPFCAICGLLEQGAEGVAFADYAPLTGPSRFMLGAFPDGLEFFCSSHAPAAKKLKQLPVREAVGQLRWDEFCRRNRDLPPLDVAERRCLVCGRANGEGSGWIEFAGRHDQRIARRRLWGRFARRRPTAPGGAWFCPEHAIYARSLADLPAPAALGYLL